jgi:hypothetical protein
MASGAAATNVGTLGGALSGTLPNPGLAALPANSVGASQITDLSVGTAELADGAVTSAKIADGTIATGDLANNAVTNAKLGTDTARLNLLTNGGFEIWQRGNGPFTTYLSYGPDRWIVQQTAPDTLSVSKNTASPDVGSGACCAVSFTKNGAGPTMLRQRIEDFANLKGRTITFSVRVQCGAVGQARVTIQDSAAFTTSANNTGVGTYETLSVTRTIGATSTSLDVYIEFLVTGSVLLDNAMLVVGSVPADYAPLHPADDLARCLRYYENMTYGQNTYLAAAQVFNTTQAAGALKFSTQKAVAPTITLSLPGAFGLANSSFGIVACTAVTIPGSSLGTSNTLGFVATVASGLVAGNASTLLVPAGQTAAVISEANP